MRINEVVISEMPDFGYSKFNYRDNELKFVKFIITRDIHDFEVYAYLDGQELGFIACKDKLNIYYGLDDVGDSVYVGGCYNRRELERDRAGAIVI